jgi:hypothetical protein
MQRIVIMNERAVYTALIMLLSSTIALTEENPLLGTWKLKSFAREDSNWREIEPIGRCVLGQ